MNMKSHFLFILTLILFAIGLTMALAVLGQTANNSDIPENLMPLAKELNCESKATCMAAFNANLSKGMSLAEKYNLYNQEQKKLAATFKDEVIAQLSTVSEDEFENKIIELAKTILSNKPKLAQQLGVDAPKIQAIETIVEEVKGVGANMNICSQPAEVLTHQQLIDCLNASRKLAEQKETVKVYIPEKKLDEIGQVLNLQEAINRGEYKELGKDADEIGAKCLQPNSPAVCNEIAKKFFGEEGLKMLANARHQVKNTEDYYKKAVGNFSLTLSNGKTIVGQEAIKDVCNNAFEKRDIATVKICGEFSVKNGFISQREFENGLKFLQSVMDKGKEQVDFDLCRKDPRACEQYLPDDMKQNFNIMADIEKIIVQEIGFNPQQCEQGFLNPEVGQKCLEGSKRVLPKLEELAAQTGSVEVRRVIDEIKMHIAEGERMDQRRNETEQMFDMGSGPGGCKSSGECFKYCSDPQNSLECLSFGAKQGYIPQEQISQRFEQYTERINTPANFIQPPIISTESKQTTIAIPRQIYMPPMPTIPNGYNPDGSPVTMGSGFMPNADCMKALQAGDFEKAKALCGIYLAQPLQSGQTQMQMAPNQYAACPMSMPAPCPMGQYRETQFVNGCAVYGACITERKEPAMCIQVALSQCPVGQYHPLNEGGCPRQECVSITTSQSKLICPSMPTVEVCPPGQNKILAYSSPECGSYYTCSSGTQPIQPMMPPKEGVIFPYRFSDGYAAKDIENAKNYCWANMKNNQSIANECQYKFGMTGSSVAPPPPSSMEKWLNHTWYFKDGGSVTSYILNRTDSEYLDMINRVDAQCKTISKERFSWLPDAGNDTIWRNFGIPDCTGQMTTSCPADQYWDAAANACRTYKTCPAGQHLDYSTNSCINDAPAACPSGNYWNGNACVPTTPPATTCPAGQYWDMNNNVCVSPIMGTCTPPAYWDVPSNSCKYPPTTTTNCGAGNYWNGNACVDMPDCPSDAYWDLSTFTCRSSTSNGYCGDNICQSTETATSCGGDCGLTGTTCPSGNYWNGSACVPTTPPVPTCPSGQTVDSATNTCKSNCLANEYWDAMYKICRSIPTCSSASYWDSKTQSCEYRPTCTAPAYWNTSTNSCVTPPTATTCPSGQYWNGSACVSSIPPVTSTCPSGQYWNGTACVTSVPPATTTCPSGNYWNGSACVPTTTPPATTCPSGQYWNGSMCVSSGSSTGGYCGDNICQSYETGMTCGSDCINNSSTGTTCPSGNYWNGSACVPTTPPVSTTCPSDQYWNGSMCVSSGSSTGGYCGDNICQSYETGMTCGSDCGGSSGYTPTPTPTGYCGDYICQSHETMATCGSDCGGNTTPPPATPTCGSTQYWNGSMCVDSTPPPTPTSDSSVTCSQSGGTWNSSTNSCQFPPTSFIGPLRYAITTTYNYFASALINFLLK